MNWLPLILSHKHHRHHRHYHCDHHLPPHDHHYKSTLDLLITHVTHMVGEVATPYLISQASAVLYGVHTILGVVYICTLDFFVAQNKH